MDHGSEIRCLHLFSPTIPRFAHAYYCLQLRLIDLGHALSDIAVKGSFSSGPVLEIDMGSVRLPFE